MKNLIYCVIAFLMLSSVKSVAKIQHLNAREDVGLENFYKHLGLKVKYPQIASASGVQGNSLILFTLHDGSLSNLKVKAELGSGCDTEVINKILSFTDFKSLKNGKYALKVTFKLDGATNELKNPTVHIPEEHTALALTIVGFTPTKPTEQPTKQASGGSPEHSIGILRTSSINKMLDMRILLDGAAIDKAAFSVIKSSEIYSVTVLRNAALTALNGKQPDGGTILITTKKAAMPTLILRAPVIKN